MDKEKEIEAMAKELHCATNESLISCRKIARILVERRGYGNVEQAVREFAEELKTKVYFYEEVDGEDVCDDIDELIRKRFGEAK